ncbi:hypothetical protein AB4505_20235, partial [Vibrio splendidus]
IVMGYLSSKIDRVNRVNVRLALTAIFSLSMISIFQYNLRSVQWFIWMMVIVILMKKFRIKFRK